MNPLTFEAVTRNPELIRALMQQARRERAEAVHRLIIVPIKSLFTRSQPQSAAAPERAGLRLSGPAPCL